MCPFQTEPRIRAETVHAETSGMPILSGHVRRGSFYPDAVSHFESLVTQRLTPDGLRYRQFASRFRSISFIIHRIELILLGDNRNRQFLDTKALARLASVPLFARRPMVGSVSGMHASPHRGSSVEFAEYRRYVPGDDLRRLDWRAYGRTDRYYVKEFEADTNLRLCLVVDTSGSMNFGSGDVTKIEYARRLAGSLAYLAVQQGDAVGLTCMGSQIVRTLPPRRTPSHLRGLNDVLEHTSPEGDTGLVERLHEFAETTRGRALVVIVSDLFVDTAGLREAFEHLRFRKHDVSVFHLLDPQEVSFDFRRPTRFVDLEGGVSMFADPSEILDRYQQAMVNYLSEMQSLVLETGVDYHRCSLEKDYEQALFEFLVRRNTGRNGR